MAKTFGNGILLWINRAGSFTPISGQQSLSKSQSAQTIDIGDKLTSPYTLEAPSALSVAISGEVWPDLPDPNGFEWMFSQSLVVPLVPERFQIRRNGLAGNGTTDVSFDCSMYILGLDESMPRNGVRGFSIRLGMAAVPTVNRVLA